jgi:Methyltransferase involved in Williams-Beuren syndrome
VVDYPNSNKAKKVFLVLLVGSGGQVPKGLEGDENAVVDDKTAQFEKRRERARTRKSTKKKSIKDRDWILKKKDVRLSSELATVILTSSSSTGNEAKKVFLEIQSTRVGNGKSPFRIIISTSDVSYHATSERRGLYNSEQHPRVYCE